MIGLIKPGSDVRIGHGLLDEVGPVLGQKAADQGGELPFPTLKSLSVSALDVYKRQGQLYVSG